jgi:hypothetical protein
MNHEHDIGGQGKTGLKTLLREAGFKPNRNQKRAICRVEGPLHLPAGPGSGKTRVLLWRTVNLIVFHGVSPSEIFLSTFTEKAARQLQEGLRALLGIPHFVGRGQKVSPPFLSLLPSLPRIREPQIDTVPPAKEPAADLPRIYSYTADYIPYQQCARQYMVFRKYGFALLCIFSYI